VQGKRAGHSGPKGGGPLPFICGPLQFPPPPPPHAPPPPIQPPLKYGEKLGTTEGQPRSKAGSVPQTVMGMGTDEHPFDMQTGTEPRTGPVQPTKGGSQLINGSTRLQSDFGIFVGGMYVFVAAAVWTACRPGTLYLFILRASPLRNAFIF
jgi:hypothetical protein